jgi:ankyrin repeat protein
MKNIAILIAAVLCQGTAFARAEGAQEPSTLVCDDFRIEAAQRLVQAPDALQVNILLFEAARKGCVVAIDSLVEHGASPLARDRHGDTPLATAAKAGRGAFVAQMLRLGAEIDRENTDGATPLLQAARANRVEVAVQLIEAGADVNRKDHKGETPLIAAAFNGSAALVERLLARAAAPDVVDLSGKAAIEYAAGRGASRVVELLLDAHVDVNRAYDADLTALMWAAGYADKAPEAEALKTVALLIQRGGAINAQDDRGQTPLMIAAGMGHASIVRALLAAGADKSLRDHTGKTAKEMASAEELRALLAP